MLKIIKETVLKPLLQRLGTIAATAMIVGGDWVCQNWQACGLVTENGADQVATYLIAVALLCFDLLTQHLDRAKGK